jgi:hypothetical protein
MLSQFVDLIFRRNRKPLKMEGRPEPWPIEFSDVHTEPQFFDKHRFSVHRIPIALMSLFYGFACGFHVFARGKSLRLRHGEWWLTDVALEFRLYLHAFLQAVEIHEPSRRPTGRIPFARGASHPKRSVSL